MSILRPYQDTGVENVRVKIREGVRSILIVAATGSGKTVVFANILASAISKGKRALVMAHRRELIHQTVTKLVDAGVPAGQVGVIMGRRQVRLAARIQVASVDTLRNRNLPHADIVVIDEAHRALAQTYVKISEQYPDAVHLGFTATPWRTDGRGLGHLYEDLVVLAGIPDLVRDGYLVDTRVYSHPRKPDLSKVRTTAGDYNEQDLAAVMDSKILLGDLVEHYRQRGGGMPAFYFACNVEHSKHIAEVFNTAGIPAAHVDGETPDAERDAALAGLRSGALKVLANCNVFTEGTDVPAVGVIGLVRPTKSRALAFQMIGRGMRLFPGKSVCVVLDHAGVVQTHGHPCEPQVYSLEDAPKKKRGAAEEDPPTKKCPSCGLEVPAQTRTCVCGHEWELKREPLVEVPGQLVEIKPKKVIELKPEQEREAYARLLEEARNNPAIHAPEAYARAIFERRIGREVSKDVEQQVRSGEYEVPAPPPKRERQPMPEWLSRQVGARAKAEKKRAEEIAAEDADDLVPTKKFEQQQETAGPRGRMEL